MYGSLWKPIVQLEFTRLPGPIQAMVSLLCEIPISEAKDAEDYEWVLNPECLFNFTGQIVDSQSRD